MIEKETYHVIPMDDLKEHLESEYCWCNPKQDDEIENLYIHNSMDEREQYEEGRKLH